MCIALPPFILIFVSSFVSYPISTSYSYLASLFASFTFTFFWSLLLLLISLPLSDFLLFSLPFLSSPFYSSPFLSSPLRDVQVNDPSPVCREAAADVIASLARRVSPDTVNTLIQYSMRWLSGSSSSGSEGSGDMDASARAIVRTGSQVAGLMVSTRPDLFKKLGFVLQSVASVRAVLITLLRVMKGGVEGGMKRGSLEKREISKEDEGKGDGGGAEAWAVSYHLLVLIEK